VLNLSSSQDLVRQCEQYRISHRNLFEKYLTHRERLAKT